MTRTAGNKTAKQETKASNQARLIDAAIRCIQQHGVARAFIDNIAREAGLSRPTAYRTFKSRKELLENVAARSIDAFKKRTKAKMKSYDTLAQALVSATLDSLYMAKRDRIFMATMEALGDEGLERHLLDPAAPAFAYTLEAWSGMFARARASGELRKDVTDHELVTLLCSVNCIFLLRDDMRKKEQIDFLRKFLLPAVLANGGHN